MGVPATAAIMEGGWVYTGAADSPLSVFDWLWWATSVLVHTLKR